MIRNVPTTAFFTQFQLIFLFGLETEIHLFISTDKKDSQQRNTTIAQNREYQFRPLRASHLALQAHTYPDKDVLPNKARCAGALQPNSIKQHTVHWHCGSLGAHKRQFRISSNCGMLCAGTVICYDNTSSSYGAETVVLSLSVCVYRSHLCGLEIAGKTIYLLGFAFRWEYSREIAVGKCVV